MKNEKTCQVHNKDQLSVKQYRGKMFQSRQTDLDLQTIVLYCQDFTDDSICSTLSRLICLLCNPLIYRPELIVGLHNLCQSAQLENTVSYCRPLPMSSKTETQEVTHTHTHTQTKREKENKSMGVQTCQKELENMLFLYFTVISHILHV